MKRALLLAVASLALLASARPSAARQAEVSNLSAEERAFVAAKIYSAVNTYFAHWQAVPGLDFDAEFKKYLARATRAESRLDFDLATMELVASLRNGHTAFYDRAMTTQGPWKWRGLWVTQVGGRWVVAGSQTEGVRRGDEIVAVDGKPVEEFYKENRKYLAASDERSARRRLFFQPFLFPEKFTLTLDGGRRVAIDRRAGTGEPPRQETEGRWLKKGELAYLKIPSFGEPRFEERALELVRQFAAAKALVIDVRGNGGGSTPSRLVKAFMERPYRWWAEATPQTLAVLRYRREYHTNTMMTWGGEVMQPSEPLFKGRLVLLADAGCASACEDFVMPFKDNGRAAVLGERTAGSTGQPYVHDFGNGMVIVVGSIRTFFPDGSPFEGVGIAPDIEAPATLEDLKSGADSALERAIEEAEKPAR
ncbi:MAG TPA: S41 family peptidase [Pyrinomonadaceae bacterium]|nr:S41 family peptidase [Pyrinomonadaceae bacterium]